MFWECRKTVKFVHIGAKSTRNRIEKQPKPRHLDGEPAPETHMSSILAVTAQIKERTECEER